VSETKTGIELEQPESVESLRRQIEDYEHRLEALGERSRTLVHEREKLSAIMDHADAGFVVIDAEHRVILANEHFRERFAPSNCGSEPCVGLPCHKVLCGRKEPCASCPSVRAFHTGVATHHELRMWIGDRSHYIYATGVPISAADGRIEQTLVMLQDVSDLEVLRRSEEAFQISEQRFRSIFDGVPAAMATLKMDGTILQVNQACCTMLGYTSSELAGRAIAEFMPTEDHEETIREFRDLAAGSQRMLETERRYLRRDGATIWGHTALFPQFDRERNPSYVVALIQNISSRKCAEQGLEHSRRRYEELVHSIDGIVWEADPQTLEFSFVSKKAQSMFGFPVERWVAQPRFWRNRIHPDDLDRVLDVISTAVAENRSSELEYRMIAADGRSIWVRDTVSVVGKAEQVKLRGVMIDITDKYQAQRALKRSEAQLQRSQKMEAIGRLAGGIAHEFNTLLTSVTGYSDVLMRALGTDHPLRREVEEISNAAQQATDLTRHLLAFGRQQTRQPRVLDLDRVVAEMELMLRRVIEEDVELVTSHSTQSALIKADAGQLQQTILNLALNAREAMPDGGRLTIRTERTEVDQSTPGHAADVPPGSYVVLSVCDTGCGMDEKTKAQLFEPFFTTKQRDQASGLGLSTVYGIVTQSGGYIVVDSQPGQGTDLRIYFPRASQADCECEASESSVPEALHGTETVLVVEDDSPVRNLAADVLEDHGYRVMTAEGGPEALSICADPSTLIDLMLTDLIMPKMNGRDLARQATQERPQMKIVYLSAYNEGHVLARDLIDPGAAFVQKPFTPVSLLHEIRKTLDASS
jgi:PAS domain S-box-containing protein